MCMGILHDDRGRRMLRCEGRPIAKPKLLFVKKRAKIIRCSYRAVRIVNDLGQRNALGVEQFTGHDADTLADRKR